MDFDHRRLQVTAQAGIIGRAGTDIRAAPFQFDRYGIYRLGIRDQA